MFDLSHIASLVGTLVVGFGFVVLCIRYPTAIVRWSAQFYRNWYKENLRMSDEQIDSFDRRRLGGMSMSEFIREAPEHPEKFKREIDICQALGIVGLLFMLIFLGVMTLIVISSIRSGKV